MWLSTCSGLASRRGRKAASSLSISAQLSKGHWFFMRSLSLTKHEEHGHNHHRHMMMPRIPKPHLVVCHSALALAILKAPLYPVALPLHPAETLRGGRRLLVAQ